MYSTQQIWNRIKERRREGDNHPLRILILGPSDDGSFERAIRCKVKDELIKLGHGAVFPEDLCEQEGAWKEDILSDIVLQAREADAIIMIYRTRGTQSERDMLMNSLLDNYGFAQKSFLFIGETLHKAVNKSLTGQDWNRIARVAKIHTYNDSNDYEGAEEFILDTIRLQTQALRRLVYVRGILKGTIC